MSVCPSYCITCCTRHSSWDTFMEEIKIKFESYRHPFPALRLRRFFWWDVLSWEWGPFALSILVYDSNRKIMSLVNPCTLVRHFWITSQILKNKRLLQHYYPLHIMVSSLNNPYINTLFRIIIFKTLEQSLELNEFFFLLFKKNNTKRTSLW